MSPSYSAPRRVATTVMTLTIVVLMAWSALAGWREMLAPPRALVVQQIAPRSQHRAAPVADVERTAPGHGTTGTTALPPLPAIATVSADLGVVPAAPFSLRGIAGGDRARALRCLTAAIYYEAASEGDAGQAAVAQVVLNRVRHPAFPASVCGVVYQGAAHAGCQFSFACDGAAARAPVGAAWARAARTAALALNGRVFASVGLATHYHTYAVTPPWNRSMVMTDAVGAHFFHRWKGYWGTVAAFRQVYGGGETMPVPVVAAVAAVPVVAQTTRRVAAPVVVEAEGDHLPPRSEILDRWKDSGKPIE